MRARAASHVAARGVWAQQIAEIIEPIVVGGSLFSAGKKEASPVSMLSTKAMPVDAYKIRNSLYLTVCRRAPCILAARMDGGIALPATDAWPCASLCERSRA